MPSLLFARQQRGQLIERIPAARHHRKRLKRLPGRQPRMAMMDQRNRRVLDKTLQVAEISARQVIYVVRVDDKMRLHSERKSDSSRATRRLRSDVPAYAWQKTRKESWDRDYAAPNRYLKTESCLPHPGVPRCIHPRRKPIRKSRPASREFGPTQANTTGRQCRRQCRCGAAGVRGLAEIAAGTSY